MKERNLKTKVKKNQNSKEPMKQKSKNKKILKKVKETKKRQSEKKINRKARKQNKKEKRSRQEWLSKICSCAKESESVTILIGKTVLQLRFGIVPGSCSFSKATDLRSNNLSEVAHSSAQKDANMATLKSFNAEVRTDVRLLFRLVRVKARTCSP